MKFVQRDLGDAAEVNSGGGDRGLRKEIVGLIFLTIGAFIAINFIVIGITELVVAGLSPQKEQELFSMGGSFGMSEDVPEEYLEKFALCQRVLEKLQAFEGVPDIEYTLVFVDDQSPNAFALPGGTIAVTKGLLKALDKEISIAFVLAHELGHFAQRDHLRGMGRRLGFGFCLQVLFGGNVDAFTQNATELILADYSRGQESGADEFGLQCIQAIYKETNGAEALFEILEEDDSMPDWAYMFSDHPENEDRIRRILESQVKQ